jgi:hypothetical protein
MNPECQGTTWFGGSAELRPLYLAGCSSTFGHYSVVSSTVIDGFVTAPKSWDSAWKFAVPEEDHAVLINHQHRHSILLPSSSTTH